MSILYPSPDLRPYAITGSNIFIASQTVTGSVFVSSSLSASQISSSNATLGNATISGDLTVNGTTTTINTTNLVVKDSLIEINKSSPAVTNANAGLVISGSGGDVRLTVITNGAGLGLNTYFSASSITGSHTGSGAGLYGIPSTGITNFSTDVNNAITLATPLTKSGTTIGVSDASAVLGGVVNTTTQTFAGNKTFSGNLIVNGNTTLGDNSSIDTLSINGNTTITGTLRVNNTISGTAVYGLSGAAAQFPNFATDVRAQFSQGTGITISNGAISASNSITNVVAGNGLIGGGSAGAITINVSGAANGGITVNTDSIQVDNTVLRTTSNYVSTIIGTSNQVLANSTSGVGQIGSITLTTPQDIATTSNVTFNTVTSSATINASVGVKNTLYSRNTPRAWVKTYRSAQDTLTAHNKGGFNISSVDGSLLSNGIVKITVHNNYYQPTVNYYYCTSLTIEDPDSHFYRNNITPTVIQGPTTSTTTTTTFTFYVLDSRGAPLDLNITGISFNFIMFAPTDTEIL